MLNWLKKTTSVSQRQGNENRDALFLFVHLPKCAGTSMLSMLSHVGSDRCITIAETASKTQAMNIVRNSSLNRSKVKVIMGRNVLYGMHDGFQSEPFYFTMLRNPVERYISQYNFYVDAAKNQNHRAHYAGSHRVLIDGKIMSLHEFALRGCDKNMMTRALADALYDPDSSDQWWWVDEETQLSQAKRMLSHMGFVGFVETFEADCQTMFEQINISPPLIQVNCSDHAAECDADVLALIQQNNLDDIALYNHAFSLVGKASQ